MNAESKLKKSTWANGQPSIEIDPYDYSRHGFEAILECLNDLLDIEHRKIISSPEKFMTTLDIDGENVLVDMDNYTCSIAFESENLRDEILEALVESRERLSSSYNLFLFASD